jgi:NAD(P)-dependent dehydrogenase (short-subunit alcohol dehydrogenase family)
MRKLKGKVAAVTGAASGLGRAMALAFDDEGMHVALGDVADTSDTLAQVERRGVNVVSMPLDVGTDHVYMNMSFGPVSDPALAYIMELAERHGLTIYDPQGDEVTRPSAAQ